MRNLTEYYKGKTILVTGGTGFIGSSVIRSLSEVECNIICCGRKERDHDLMTGTRAIIRDRRCDIRSPAIWDKILEGVDIVFHFAAQTSSQFANQNPCEDMEINLTPIACLIDTCQKKEIRPDIIFPGTVTQVGFTTSYPVDERACDVPITVYDINKLAVEKYLHYYGSQMGGRAATLRLANVYGPGPKSGRPDRGILNMMVMRALGGEPLTVFGKGNFVRDYIFIDDVVSAFLIAGAGFPVTNGKYYVLGSGVGHTIREMAEAVRNLTGKISGKSVEIQHVPPPASLSQIELRHFVANTSRFRADTGWVPRVTLEEGIKRTIESFLRKDNP